MIESGIWTWVITNSSLQVLLGQSSQDKTAGTWNSFYFSFLPKQPILPGTILDRLKSDEADDTLDARTSAPGVEMEAKFQFGCVAQDSPENPANLSGYLSVVLLARALRLQLMGLATGVAFFPDGTLVKDVRIDDEFDAHFELGGTGYIYRRMLVVTIWYVETDAAAPAPQFYENFGAPAALKNDGDLYYDELTGNLYEQVFGDWDLVGNIPVGGGSTEMPSIPYHKVCAAGTNAAVIKAAAGTVTGWKIYNNANYPIFVKVYDKATAPTPETDTPRQTIGVDAGDSDLITSAGYIYATGIGIAIVKGIADGDATPVLASDCVVDIFYQ